MVSSPSFWILSVGLVLAAASEDLVLDGRGKLAECSDGVVCRGFIMDVVLLVHILTSFQVPSASGFSGIQVVFS